MIEVVMNDAIATQAAAAALSGEKSHITLQVVDTGDAATTLSLLVLSFTRRRMSASEAACVCRYLAERLQYDADQTAKWQGQHPIGTVGGLGGGTIGGTASSPVSLYAANSSLQDLERQREIAAKNAQIRELYSQAFGKPKDA